MDWDDREMRAGNQHLILLPAGRQLGIRNYPGAQGHYVADVELSCPALQVSLSYREQIGNWPGHTSDLCVPLDRHTALAWDNLLECIASDAPDALRSHYGEAVLLALALGGWAAPLLLDRRDPLCERVQHILMGNPARDWTVACVAERLNLGPRPCAGNWQTRPAASASSPENVRLGMALQWLQTTARPIGRSPQPAAMPRHRALPRAFASITDCRPEHCGRRSKRGPRSASGTGRPTLTIDGYAVFFARGQRIARAADRVAEQRALPSLTTTTSVDSQRVPHDWFWQV